MLFLQPLFKFLGETDDLPVQGDEFNSQLLQFIEHGKGFLLGESGMQSLDCLVIVYTDPAVFALQIGQLDVVVRRRLVYFHDFHRLVEKGGKNELRFGFSSRVFEKPFKFNVLELVQTESIIKRMKLRFFFRSPSASSFTRCVSPPGLACATDFSHIF